MDDLREALRQLIELASVESTLEGHAAAAGDTRVAEKVRAAVGAIGALYKHVDGLRRDAWLSGAAADYITQFGVDAEVLAEWGIKLSPAQRRLLTRAGRSAVASAGVAAIAKLLGVHERSVYKARKRGAVKWTALRAVPMEVCVRDQLYFVLGLFGFDRERCTEALQALGVDTEDPR